MRPIRPWHLLLVGLALFVPIQAGALPSKGAGLSVSASLGECGVGGSGVVCRIDASWSGIEDATRYTAAVTLADGSVRSLGTVGGGGGGSTSVWVPYVGSGTYSVMITAWGSDEEGEDEKIDDEDAETRIEGDGRESGPKDVAKGDEQEKGAEAPQGPGAGEGGGEKAEPEAPVQEPSAEEPSAEEPSAEEPPAEEPPAPVAGGDGPGAAQEPDKAAAPSSATAAPDLSGAKRDLDPSAESAASSPGA